MKKYLAILAIVLCTITFIPAATFAAASAVDTTGWEPVKPEFQLVTRLYVELNGERLNFGKTSDLGERRIIPITGGRFEGPMLNGVVLNQGADWQIGRADGVTMINARYVLKTDDGALIYISTQGIKWASPEIIEKQKLGPVHPSEYFFRQYLFFETAAPNYAWLNRVIAIGTIMGGVPVNGGKGIVQDIYLVK